jgi:Tol biopolymer transport system component
VSAYDPDWSPDGRRLVIELQRTRPFDTDIAVVRANGTEFRRLTHGRRYDDGAPSFSPDGHTIAFTRVANVLPVRLVESNLSGKRVRGITSSPNSEFIVDLDWQPLPHD